MVNKRVFVGNAPRSRQVKVAKPDTVNKAGGAAYALSSESALAQYAVTGTFAGTFYANADAQLERTKELASNCSSQFIAKLAVYARESGKMKDMPAYLLATLAAREEIDLLHKVFPRVINNAKLLCNFVQIIRSGVTGRRSFGTSIKRLIQNWLTSRTGIQLYNASIGHANPSLADVIRMVHPRPQDQYQQATLSYLLGKTCTTSDLPVQVQILEQLKNGSGTVIPNVPFRALTNIKLNVAQWQHIALTMPWDTLRQNLNSLHRKGVFCDSEFNQNIADKLADAAEVRKNNVFPYQLMTAYQNTEDIPAVIRNALQMAMEVACENVPVLAGKTLIAVDVSGSMKNSITGSRPGTTSVTRCVDVAALIATALLRTNQDALVLAFDAAGWGRTGRDKLIDGVYLPRLNPSDPVMTNANRLASYGGGATDVALPFQYLSTVGEVYDNVILISDNESWSGICAGANMAWNTYAGMHKGAKLINIDIQPSDSTQVPDYDGRVLNVGGWSDAVFNMMSEFFTRGNTKSFVDVINEVQL